MSIAAALRIHDQVRPRASGIDAWGHKRERVLLRSGGTETPYTHGRILVLRYRGWLPVWTGLTDADAWYEVRGLEMRELYVALAIDLQGLQEATAAGPWSPDPDPDAPERLLLT